MILILCVYICFLKQKTAYELRISDWSSDVCSSDLVRRVLVAGVFDPAQVVGIRVHQQPCARHVEQWPPLPAVGEALPRPHYRESVRSGGTQCAQQDGFGLVVSVVGERERFAVVERVCECIAPEIGRASCRERVCQYV